MFFLHLSYMYCRQQHRQQFKYYGWENLYDPEGFITFLFLISRIQNYNILFIFLLHLLVEWCRMDDIIIQLSYMKPHEGKLPCFLFVFSNIKTFFAL